MSNEMDDTSNGSSRDDGASDPTDTGSGNDGTKGVEHKEETVVIAKKETKDVVRLKVVVALVLIISTAAVAFTVHHTMSSNEKDNFRKTFDDDADKILSAVSNALDSILGSFDSLAVTTVSMARATNQTWPFVTVPDFAVRMSKFVPLSRTFVVFMTPVVQPEQRKEWEAYTVEHDSWVNECVDVQDDYSGYFGDHEYDTESYGTIHGDFEDIPYNVSRPHLATWQSFPVAPNTPYTYNWDWLSISFPEAPMACLDHHEIVFSPPYMIAAPGDTQKEEETAAWGEFFQRYNAPHENPIEPVSDLFFPIVEQIDHVHVTSAKDYDPSAHTIVGVWGASIYWRSIFQDALPKASKGIHVVMENECSSLPFTYQINGPDTKYLGVGDLHETKYDGFSNVHHRLDTLSGFGADGSMYSGPRVSEHCPFTLHIYPSDEMKIAFVTNSPILFTLAVIMIFAFTALVFAVYDWKVERRQQTVMSNATRASAIVSSLFPSVVRDQLYPLPGKATNKYSKFNSFRAGVNSRVPVDDASGSMGEIATASPIASLYADTTVLFADIVGFTAWSSERQPAQVFLLLESVYAAFDELARQRGVYKVETIGDSYVAVVGLPAPRKDHAVVMARFANDCRSQMHAVVVDLAKTLGPGTDNLAMRFGLNSGPTTAGVLRGDKARFQLFGDTVNTAARMESNGERDRIQVSAKTADLIRQAGKGHWLSVRGEKVECKGKGLMTTYWCEPNTKATSLVASETSHTQTYMLPNSETVVTPDIQLQRLIDWNVDLFSGLLKEVMHYRQATRSKHTSTKGLHFASTGTCPVDEVTEVLCLPKTRSVARPDLNAIELGPQVSAQLNQLIATIGRLYRSNPFHNFEHASHVTMSAKKLLDRIHENSNGATGRTGCAFDPVVKFAVVFASLIHDVDHPGVSNAQLVHEQCPLAVTYSGQSVAEQNSIDVAWTLLMDQSYTDLRRAMFANDDDVQRFRSVLVNVVMATDLFDANLQRMRESRWNASFHSQVSESSPHDHVNRRATIVMDLVLQASDVSHTMQHFTVYKSWNLRLLTELYAAHQSGRLNKDPLDGWYEGELWFFDNYVIPLAEKLGACGVFGVSCDEFLDYAKDNRLEWQTVGRDIVRDAADHLRNSFPPPVDASESDGLEQCA